MKKTYSTPTLHEEYIQTEGLIALSLQSGKADSSDALTKDAGEWEDIWGDE